MMNFYSLGPKKVTLFGNKVIATVMCCYCKVRVGFDSR